MISERPQGLQPARPAGGGAQSPVTAQPAGAEMASRDVEHRGFAALLEQATQEILAVTFWFEPAARPEPHTVTVRFIGRRIDVDGPLQPTDRFVWEETIDTVMPGSGPVSVTARVPNLHPGTWAVTAQVQGADFRARGGPRSRHHPHHAHHSAALVAASTHHHDYTHEPAYPFLPRLWRRWAPAAGSRLEAAEPVQTCLAPLARAPGIVPLSWITLVALGMALALAMQALVIAMQQLDVRRVLIATSAAIAAGIVGAKGWFIIKHRREQRIEGWCIQGFIAVASLAALLLYPAFGLPTGIVLDATAPGLLGGLAVGRIGCFLAGCCGGPPTAARWGVWSSDQRVGARRVPTQLLESALSLGLGLVAFVMVVGHGPAGGALFVATLAAYTLGRQGLLRLRAEPRRTQWAVPVTAVAAAVVLVAGVVVTIFA